MSEPAKIIKIEKRHAIYSLAIDKLIQEGYPYSLCMALQAAVYELYPTLARYYDPIRNGLELYPEVMDYKPAELNKLASWFNPADYMIRLNILQDAANRTNPNVKYCIICGKVTNGLKTCPECFDAF